jgi:hypothetical protein
VAVVQNNLRSCPACGSRVRRGVDDCRKCGAILRVGFVVLGEDPWATVYWWIGDEWQLDQRGMPKAEYYARERAERDRVDREKADRAVAGRANRPEPRLIRRAAEAEGVCAEWVRWMGFPGAVVTGDGADGGIDVLGDGPTGRIAAQVKFEAVPTGRPKLQELLGAGVASRANVWAFFASAGYTNQAKVWADSVGMALFGFALDGSVEPNNEAARQLLEG